MRLKITALAALVVLAQLANSNPTAPASYEQLENKDCSHVVYSSTGFTFQDAESQCNQMAGCTMIAEGDNINNFVAFGACKSTSRIYDNSGHTVYVRKDSCNDGIMNNVETAIDCGGAVCDPCRNRFLGCWKDDIPRAIPLLEGKSAILNEHYTIRANPIQKCRDAAVGEGYNVFAIQDGGQCFSSAGAKDLYNVYGTSTACSHDGKGGPMANSVYEIGT